LVPVSRRSFYRSLKEQRPAEEVTEVRSVIQQIALEHRRRYGIDESPRSSAAEECR
jgi:putative transposase